MATYTTTKKEDTEIKRFTSRHKHTKGRLGSVPSKHPPAPPGQWAPHIYIGFTNTGIGQRVDLLCTHCGKRKDATEYDQW
jgi:hypothetical protein